MYKLIIFDMDGTLADTSPGIIAGHKYTNVKMGRKEPTDEQLSGIIGGPLMYTYTKRFGFSEEDAIKAIAIYRERYATRGIYEAELYAGMKETLAELKKRGYKLAVATLKAESFAKTMLKNMGAAEYFDVIYGVDDNYTRTKADLILLSCEFCKVSASEAALVGDSIHDENGAISAGVDFVACTYGFGFSDERDLDGHKSIATAGSPKDLLNIFI